MTTLPLIFFNNATKKLKLSTVGFFQYINPSMGFFIAIFLYNEPISIEKLSTFGLIWFALVLVTLDSLKKKKLQ